MKRQLSLKWFISLAFLSLGVVMVVGYTLLSAHFYIRGMDNIVAGNMEKAARTYLKTIPPAKQAHLNEFSGSFISHYWIQQPSEVQQAFGRPPVQRNELLKYDDSGWLKRPDKIVFVMQLKVDGQRLFVSRILSAANASALVGHNAKESMKLLLIISAITVLTFAVIIWLLLRRVAQPVSRLVHWTRSLDSAQLSQPKPDFLYPELNEMATLIKNSLSSVQDSLHREQQFLRYTSHELRTPISIIRNNIELIHKLEQKQPQLANNQFTPMIERIDRASLTMQHLTEVLLWLSRDIDTTLNEHPFQLDALIHKIVDELRYLLKDKPVSIELNTEPYQVRAPEIAAAIVISNLIRNAFQHTFEGQVVIQQQMNQVLIHNQQHHDTTANLAATDLGFGLGLQLTAQLTKKLGWHYQNQVNHDGHHVTLHIGQTVQTTITDSLTAPNPPSNESQS